MFLVLIKFVNVAFFIAAFSNSGVIFVNLAVAWAVLAMVINNAAGLQVRIYRYAAKVFKTAFFQIAADGIGQAVAGRDVTFAVLVV